MPTVLVTGANRGLGLEFARQYAADGWHILASVRDPGEGTELATLSALVEIHPLELRDLASIEAFSRRLAGRPIDVLVANAGTWGPEDISRPADAEAWVDTLAVNSVAPTVLALSLLDNVAAASGRMVAITSKMGSIADNRSGGYIAYRSSKAALNAAWKSLAIEAAGRGIVAAVLHPGWVQTRMGGPSAPLTPPESVAGMRRVIAGLTPAKAGGFYNYDGTPIPW
jgi:NAD(P)-dependent dehydrogenase (short-subunit alcohol dehydrogenase family)